MQGTSSHFDIRKYILQVTRLDHHCIFKLVHLRSNISVTHHFYFTRLVRQRNSCRHSHYLPDHTIELKLIIGHLSWYKV